MVPGQARTTGDATNKVNSGAGDAPNRASTVEELRVVAAVSKSPLLAMLVALGAMVFGVLLISAASNDPDVLVGIALTTGLAMAVVAIIVGVRRSRARRAMRRRLLDEGIVTKARIVSAKSNGALNNDPYVDFVLEVLPEGEDPYHVAYRTLVSQIAIPRVQPGNEIDVYVDPADPAAVLIDPSVTS